MTSQSTSSMKTDHLQFPELECQRPPPSVGLTFTLFDSFSRLFKGIWDFFSMAFNPTGPRKLHWTYPPLTADEILAQAHRMQNVPTCAEYEKMILGQQYAHHPFRTMTSVQLMNTKILSRHFSNEYNNMADCRDVTLVASRKWREQLLRDFAGKVGIGSIVIEPPVFFSYGCNVEFGSGCYINRNAQFFDSTLIIFGDRVLLGPNVTIATDTHNTDPASRRRGEVYAKPIRIGDDCWIGAGVTVLAGVTIGKSCTIGAGALVNRDVEEYSVAVGVPARVIKKKAPPVEMDGTA